MLCLFLSTKNFQAHISRDVDVMEYLEANLKGLRHFRITHVENPTHFYVHHVTEAGEFNISWQAQMQVYYNSLEVQRQYKLVSSFECYYVCILGMPRRYSLPSGIRGYSLFFRGGYSLSGIC